MTENNDQTHPAASKKPGHPAVEDVTDARAAGAADPPPDEKGGPKGKEPTRYGDWENKGIAWDF